MDKIYNAQNIVETEQLVEMLKQNGIAAFSQEAGANVAMHGAPGFGIYGVDIFVKTDDAEKAVQLIKEINNQEWMYIFTVTVFSHPVTVPCPPSASNLS